MSGNQNNDPFNSMNPKEFKDMFSNYLSENSNDTPIIVLDNGNVNTLNIISRVNTVKYSNHKEESFLYEHSEWNGCIITQLNIESISPLKYKFVDIDTSIRTKHHIKQLIKQQNIKQLVIYLYNESKWSSGGLEMSDDERDTFTTGYDQYRDLKYKKSKVLKSKLKQLSLDENIEVTINTLLLPWKVSYNSNEPAKSVNKIKVICSEYIKQGNCIM